MKQRFSDDVESEGRLEMNLYDLLFLVKHKQWDIFLAVNYFHFFKTCGWAKEMIYLDKNSSAPAQKLDLEN